MCKMVLSVNPIKASLPTVIMNNFTPFTPHNIYKYIL